MTMPDDGGPANTYQVEEARRMGVCRICHEPIRVSHAMAGWQHEFREMLYPQAVTLNFGDEFAHTACLAAERAEGDDART